MIEEAAQSEQDKAISLLMRMNRRKKNQLLENLSL
jgi:hypothetical protein